VKLSGIAAVESVGKIEQSGENTQLMAGAATSTTLSVSASAPAHGAAISAATALQRTTCEVSMVTPCCGGGERGNAIIRTRVAYCHPHQEGGRDGRYSIYSLNTPGAAQD
jgi:hypothetical protein